MEVKKEELYKKIDELFEGGITLKKKISLAEKIMNLKAIDEKEVGREGWANIPKYKKFLNWLASKEGEMIFEKMLDAKLITPPRAYCFTTAIQYYDYSLKEIAEKAYISHQRVQFIVQDTIKRLEKCKELYKKGVDINEWWKFFNVRRFAEAVNEEEKRKYINKYKIFLSRYSKEKDK